MNQCACVRAWDNKLHGMHWKLCERLATRNWIINLCMDVKSLCDHRQTPIEMHIAEWHWQRRWPPQNLLSVSLCLPLSSHTQAELFNASMSRGSECVRVCDIVTFAAPLICDSRFEGVSFKLLGGVRPCPRHCQRNQMHEIFFVCARWSWFRGWWTD